MTASTTSPSAPPRTGFKLNEDWLATLVGLFIVAVVGFGLLGPGAQSAALKAEPGQVAHKEAHALDGWKAAAKLDGETIAIENAPTALADGQTYVFTCADGALRAALAESPVAGVDAPVAGRAQIVVVNDCAASVDVTLTSSALMRWPLFNWFK